MAEAERICDQKSCQTKVCAYTLKIDLVSDPDRPQNQTLALVLACTRKPPFLTGPDGKGTLNPEWDPRDMVVAARWSRGFDVCSLDCFLNQMETFWRLAERRAKRLWETGEQDWR